MGLIAILLVVMILLMVYKKDMDQGNPFPFILSVVFIFGMLALMSPN